MFLFLFQTSDSELCSSVSDIFDRGSLARRGAVLLERSCNLDKAEYRHATSDVRLIVSFCMM